MGLLRPVKALLKFNQWLSLAIFLSSIVLSFTVSSSFILGESISHVTERFAEQTSSYLVVDKGLSKEQIERLRSLNGLKEMSSLSWFWGTLRGERVQVFLIRGFRSDLLPVLIRGSYPGEGACAMTESLLLSLGLKLGDEINLSFDNGNLTCELTGTVSSWPLARTSDLILLNGSDLDGLHRVYLLKFELGAMGPNLIDVTRIVGCEGCVMTLGLPEGVALSFLKSNQELSFGILVSAIVASMMGLSTIKALELRRYRWAYGYFISAGIKWENLLLAEVVRSLAPSLAGAIVGLALSWNYGVKLAVVLAGRSIISFWVYRTSYLLEAFLLTLPLILASPLTSTVIIVFWRRLGVSSLLER